MKVLSKCKWYASLLLPMKKSKNHISWCLKLKLDFETTPYKILPVQSLIRFRFPKVTEEKYYHFLLCKNSSPPRSPPEVQKSSVKKSRKKWCDFSLLKFRSNQSQVFLTHILLASVQTDTHIFRYRFRFFWTFSIIIAVVVFC